MKFATYLLFLFFAVFFSSMALNATTSQLNTSMQDNFLSPGAAASSLVRSSSFAIAPSAIAFASRIKPALTRSPGEVKNCPVQRLNTKAIIFDCDGTLVDTDAIQFLAWEYAFQQQGYYLSREEYWHLMRKHSLAGLPSAYLIIAELGSAIVGRDCSQTLVKDFEVYFDELRVKGFPAIEATVSFLHQLANEKVKLGLKLGLASGARKHQILDHLRHLGIEGYFDVILSGSDDLNDYIDSEGTNKPKPYIYSHAAKLLGLLPQECIAIEDSRTGVLSAVDAGCVTVAIPNAITMDQDLSDAHLRMESFLGVSPAVFLQMIANL